MKKIALFLAFLMLLGGMPAFASDMYADINKMAGSDRYMEKMGGMLIDGTMDVVNAPLDLVYHPIDGVIERHDFGLGFLRGLGDGTRHALEGLGAGVMNIGLSLIPGQNGLRHQHAHPMMG